MEDDDQISVSLPHSFLKVYINHLQTLNEKHTTYSDNSLLITFAELETFYKSVVEGIISSISECLN